MKRESLHRLFGRLGALLLALQVLLFLVSWLVTAVMPGTTVHSLLAGDGVRWFIGRFADNLATPLLVWLLLAAFAWGAVRQSGLLPTLKRLFGNLVGSSKSAEVNRVTPMSFRERYALTIVLAELLLLVVIVVLLTAIPHAALLSATGHLFPSSFSRGLVPMACFSVSLMAVSFGLATGRFRSSSDVFGALSSGVASWLPLWLLYVLAVQFYSSLCFVFLS